MHVCQLKKKPVRGKLPKISSELLEQFIKGMMTAEVMDVASLAGAR